MLSLGIQRLSKRFGALAALEQVSLEFEPALIHGVIGPDGAGKTTLLRLLMGLYRPSAGVIEYRSNGTLLDLAQVKPRLAYMPQQQSLYPDLSISEHLDFFRELYQLPTPAYHARREELLHLTRLKPFADRPAGQLSGGMYKKLGLMCALLPSPLAVLLDEPTNGVDPISRRELWEMLYRLQRTKVLVLLTTSYMDEAERCGRVHVLDQGRVLATGEPRAILRQARVTSFERFFQKRSEVPA